MKSRLQQILMVVTFLGFSWLMMQVFHESGHILGAIVTGADVEKVVLYPTVFSRTDINSNNHPLFVVWAGPIIGIVVPVVLWLSIHRIKFFAVLARFLAGFCCIANGAYIGFGPDGRGLDTQIMLSLGCARWQLLIFGISMISLGLWLLNGTGKEFGIGQRNGQVRPLLMWFSIASLIIVMALEIAMNMK